MDRFPAGAKSADTVPEGELRREQVPMRIPDCGAQKEVWPKPGLEPWVGCRWRTVLEWNAPGRAP